MKSQNNLCEVTLALFTCVMIFQREREKQQNAENIFQRSPQMLE